MAVEILEQIIAGGRFVLGEYTTNVGPYAEDRFFVLVSQKHGELEFADSDPDAILVLERIGAHAGKNIEPMLGDSAELASRVLYPCSLRGRDLYRWQSEKRGWFRDFWMRSARRVLSNEVSTYLQGESENPPPDPT